MRLLPSFDDFRYWLSQLTGIPVFFYCRRTICCSGCLSSVWMVNDHRVSHVACRHCTWVPDVRCRRCGNIYFDSVPPGSQWMFTLFDGWRHTNTCK